MHVVVSWVVAVMGSAVFLAVWQWRAKQFAYGGSSEADIAKCVGKSL